jgi:hypothetical protein
MPRVMEDDLFNDGWLQRSGDQLFGGFVPEEYVDTLITQPPKDPTNPAPAHSRACGDSIHSGIVALDSELGPKPGYAGDGRDFDYTCRDFGDLLGKKPYDHIGFVVWHGALRRRWQCH